MKKSTEEETKFFFQVEKNVNKELETEDDYEACAKECFHQANAFYEVALRSKELLLHEESMAVYTNITFACELYFKSLLFDQMIDCRKTHDLFILYKRLPKNMQEQIKESHPCSNIAKKDFELNLKELGKAFIVFRYVYEKKRLAFNARFLLELVDTLHCIIKE